MNYRCFAALLYFHESIPKVEVTGISKLAKSQFSGSVLISLGSGKAPEMTAFFLHVISYGLRPAVLFK